MHMCQTWLIGCWTAIPSPSPFLHSSIESRKPVLAIPASHATGSSQHLWGIGWTLLGEVFYNILFFLDVRSRSMGTAFPTSSFCFLECAMMELQQPPCDNEGNFKFGICSDTFKPTTSLCKNHRFKFVIATGVVFFSLQMQKILIHS